jgi:arylsulfatase
VETPNISRLADNGLRYTNFQTTALCSPTRACLLTGRNHHSVGMADVTELATGFPGYNGRQPADKAAIGAILHEHGLQQLRRRQVAQHPRRGNLGRRSLRPLA